MKFFFLDSDESLFASIESEDVFSVDGKDISDSQLTDFYEYSNSEQ